MTIKTYKINQRYLQISHRELNRRDFLWLGSAFSLGLLSTVAFKANYVSKSDDLVTPITNKSFTNNLLSLGFWNADKIPGSFNPENIIFQDLTNEQFTSQIVAADSLPTGDINFLTQGANINIQPINFHLWENTDLYSLTANVYYQPRELEQEIKFCTWCFSSQPVLNLGATTNLFLPINSPGLKFSFELKNSQDSSVQEIFLHLSVGGESKTPKLRQGVYVIAGKSKMTGQLPIWHQYELRTNNINQQPYLFSFNPHQNQSFGVDFPYLLITVNYGKSNLKKLSSIMEN